MVACEGSEFAARQPRTDDGVAGCITCGDVATPMRVTVLHGDGTATARDDSGAAHTISIEMVPGAEVGDDLLVHAGFAIAGGR